MEVSSLLRIYTGTRMMPALPSHKDAEPIEGRELRNDKQSSIIFEERNSVCKLWKQTGRVIAVWRSILWYLLIQLISFCGMGWKGLIFVFCHKDWELNHSVALGSDHVNSTANRQTWAWCLAQWWSVLSFRRWNCATFTRSQLKSHRRHPVAFSFDA